MSNEILKDVRLSIGLNPEYEDEFKQIFLYIESCFDILYQLGVGSKQFAFEENSKWEDFYKETNCSMDLNLIKPYICFKTKVWFDPPNNSNLLQSLNEQIKELENRIVYYTEVS